MNISAYVLEEFSKDYPDVTHIYAKSDNAGCYHGNNILENLYKLCKRYGITLVRYDYNEPCKGKDQCDRESAGAKRVLSSYVESGHDILTADDVYQGLHYGSVLRNTKVSVLEINSEESSLNGPNITGIHSYHSAVFCEDKMKLYRYYNIGSGKSVTYSSTSTLSKVTQ